MLAWVYLLLAFIANSFADLPSYVGMWKYSGSSFSFVQFLQLRPSAEGFSRTASVKVSPLGTYDYSPYTSLLTQHPEPFIPSYAQYSNPVTEEMGEAYDFFDDAEFCNFLLHNQEFPLAEMLGRNIIPAQMRPELLENSLKLRPDQVTFLEAVRSMEDQDIIFAYGEIPSHARRIVPTPKTAMSLPDWLEFYGTFYDNEVYTPEEQAEQKEKIKQLRLAEEKEAARTFYDVKSASAWLISGQTPTRAKALLPLEEFGTGIRLAKPIDRRTYPLIWEIGRAAQIHDGDLNQVLQAAFLQIQTEVALLAANKKVDLRKAYVFAHSLDAQHTRLYQSAFGMQIYSGYVQPGHGEVLVAKVTDFMKKIKMNNLLDQQEISIHRLQNNLQRLHSVTNSYFGGAVVLRDFSLGNELSPPVSRLERYAYDQGARNPDRWPKVAPPPYRFDGLFDRMADAYRERKSLPFGSNYEFDHYIRLRWHELEAMVIDLGSWAREDDPASFLTAFALAARDAHAPQTIGFLHEGGAFGPRVQGLFAALNVHEENVLFVPTTSRTTGFGIRARTTIINSGSRLDLLWFDFARVKEYLQKHPVDVSKLKPDDHWDEPLPGT
jgi:hypothetical protein